MKRIAALAPVLLVAAASAATITIDDYTSASTVTASSLVGGATSGWSTYSLLPVGANRQIKTNTWSVGSSTLSVGSGTASVTNNVGYGADMEYYFASSTSLLPNGAAAGESTAAIHIANNAGNPLGFTVTFWNNAYEVYASWYIVVASNTTGLQSSLLTDISADFVWDQVDAITVSFGNNVAGSLILGGDGLGLRISTPTAPVPEPSTYGLVLGGLALAVGVARRRRK